MILLTDLSVLRVNFFPAESPPYLVKHLFQINHGYFFSTTMLHSSISWGLLPTLNPTKVIVYLKLRFN